MVRKIKAMGSDGKKERESIGMVEGLIEAVLSLIEPSPWPRLLHQTTTGRYDRDLICMRLDRTPFVQSIRYCCSTWLLRSPPSLELIFHQQTRFLFFLLLSLWKTTRFAAFVNYSLYGILFYHHQLDRSRGHENFGVVRIEREWKKWQSELAPGRVVFPKRVTRAPDD